jgi:thioredoxin 1
MMKASSFSLNMALTRTLSRVAIVFSLVVVGACSQEWTGPYDAGAEPATEFDKAMKQAILEDKFVLVVFGANWCADCRALEERLSTEPLHRFVNEKFISMHVDIGNWDKNMAFAATFGRPVDKGIPSIAIVDKDGSIQFVSTAGELAKARKMSGEALMQWLSGLVQPNAG